MISQIFRLLAKRGARNSFHHNGVRVALRFCGAGVHDELGARRCFASATATFSAEQLVEPGYQQLAGGSQFRQLHCFR